MDLKFDRQLAKLTKEELDLHNVAVTGAASCRQSDSEMIDIIQSIDAAKLYEKFELPSLTSYCLKVLKLSEHTAGHLIHVARKSVRFPELKKAMADGQITLSAARVIATKLTHENKDELITKASKMTRDQLEADLRSPDEKNKKARLKELIKRAEEVLGQSGDDLAIEAYSTLLEKHDPIKKAERAAKRKEREVRPSTYDPHPNAPKDLKKRKPIQASIIHKVNLRDQRQCCVVEPDGQRCTNRKWLDIHHIRPVSFGGRDELDNLVTICSAHHRMHHRGQRLSAKLGANIISLR